MLCQLHKGTNSVSEVQINKTKGDGKLIGLVVGASTFSGKLALYFMVSVRVFVVNGVEFHSVPISSVLAFLESEEEDVSDEATT